MNETEADAVERRQAEADAEKRWRDALRARETEADTVARRRAEADGDECSRNRVKLPSTPPAGDRVAGADDDDEWSEDGGGKLK